MNISGYLTLLLKLLPKSSFLLLLYMVLSLITSISGDKMEWER